MSFPGHRHRVAATRSAPPPTPRAPARPAGTRSRRRPRGCAGAAGRPRPKPFERGAQRVRGRSTQAHLAPGDGMPSSLSRAAMLRGLQPSAYSSKTRRTTAASAALISICPLALSRAGMPPALTIGPPKGMPARPASYCTIVLAPRNRPPALSLAALDRAGHRGKSGCHPGYPGGAQLGRGERRLRAPLGRFGRDADLIFTPAVRPASLLPNGDTAAYATSSPMCDSSQISNWTVTGNAYGNDAGRETCTHLRERMLTRRYIDVRAPRRFTCLQNFRSE